MRLWVRLDLKVNSSPQFSRTIGCAPNTPEGGVLYQPSAPISGQSDSRGLAGRVKKKRELFSGHPLASWGSFALPRTFAAQVSVREY